MMAEIPVWRPTSPVAKQPFNDMTPNAWLRRAPPSGRLPGLVKRLLKRLGMAQQQIQHPALPAWRLMTHLHRLEPPISSRGNCQDSSGKFNGVRFAELIEVSGPWKKRFSA
jgi:hypothetical protein